MANAKKQQTKERISKVMEGEQVRVINPHLPEDRRTVYDEPAKLPCEMKDCGRWYCVTHALILENNWDKESHLQEGTHRLAWICFEHGPEVP